MPDEPQLARRDVAVPAMPQHPQHGQGAGHCSDLHGEDRDRARRSGRDRRAALRDRDERGERQERQDDGGQEAPRRLDGGRTHVRHRDDGGRTEAVDGRALDFVRAHACVAMVLGCAQQVVGRLGHDALPASPGELQRGVELGQVVVDEAPVVHAAPAITASTAAVKPRHSSLRSRSARRPVAVIS